ncbi:MAG: hypothetical protein U0166_17595 [Acidobacteriota bacterium]
MRVTNLGTALPVERFWTWLHEHHNCIVSAGTPDVWIYDADDLHWHLTEDPGGKLGVEVCRGKQVVAEMSIVKAEVLYVDVGPSLDTQGHFEFQLMGGPEGDQYALYHFVTAHGYEDEDAHKTATH